MPWGKLLLPLAMGMAEAAARPALPSLTKSPMCCDLLLVANFYDHDTNTKTVLRSCVKVKVAILGFPS